MDAQSWRQVRELFDTVCDLPSEQWHAELSRLSVDPAVIAETLELLGAQTVDLQRAQHPFQQLLRGGDVPELAEGDLLGPWRLIRRLASGGMGVVFLAERADDLYARQVAIKLLQGIGDERVSDRLAAERRILASLQHPNIARLYDGGTTPAGNPYLVMEYVEGEPLDRYCRHHACSLGQRLGLFLKICQAVQLAHSKLVLHCDLKPANILVRADGEPILLDFGVARIADGIVPAERMQFCTPAYAAPELLPSGTADTRSDVFGLGVVLTELLSDQSAGRSMDTAQLPVTLPSKLAEAQCRWHRALRGDLDAIVARACALPPEQRYPSVEALAADVQNHCAHRPVKARNGGRLYRIGRWLRRSWKGVVVAVGMLLLVSWFVWKLELARAQAEREAEVAREVTNFMVEAFDAANPRKGDLRGSSEISARAVLEAGRVRIEGQQWNSPSVKARLQVTLAQAFQNVSRKTEAEALYRSALPILLAAGPQQRETAYLALNDLSVLLANSQRGREAEAFARQALALLGDAADPESLSRGYNSLGLALNALRRFDESAAAFDQALALRRAHGAKPLAIATVLQNKALMHIERGQYPQAEALLGEADVIRRRWAPQTSEWWGGQFARMRAVAADGRYEEALRLGDELLPLALRLYGPETSRIGMLHNERAGQLQDLGRYAEAAAEYQHALDSYARIYVEPDMDVALLLNNFATLEEARGNTQRAIDLYQRSLQMRRQLVGDDVPQVWAVESNLARLLVSTGMLAQAEVLAGHARDGWSAQGGAMNPRRLLTELTWIELLVEQGRWDEADQSLAQVKRDDDGGDMRVQRRYLAALAMRLQRGDSPQAALQTWQALVTLLEEQAGEDAMATALQRVHYADALVGSGQCELGRVQVRKASARLEQLVDGSVFRRKADKILKTSCR